MSRHILKPRPEAPDIRRATVGWDRPLQTFFAQVFTRSDDADDDEGNIFIWLGTEPGELPTAEAALAVLAPYALIPAELEAVLIADMTATIGVRDGRHQAEAKRQLFGSIH